MPLILLVASLIAFLLPLASGVDPVTAVLRARAVERAPDPEVLAQLQEELGLDRSPFIRYLRWIGDLVTGDLGLSYVSREPVAPTLLRALAVTTVLAIGALTIAMVLGLVLGALSASYRDRLLDRAVTAAANVAVAVPSYVLGPLLILVAAVQSGALPSSGWSGPSSAVLPVITLAAPTTALVALLTRAELCEALNADYVRAARGKGLGRVRVLAWHALPNALTPVVAVMGPRLAGLLGGSVVVEVVFGIPGFGRALHGAVLAGDLPVIQAGLVLAVAVAVLVGILTDLLHVSLDPRLRGHLDEVGA